jgi:4-hydroxythreonine-4-phosphate dehydrogenase
VVSELPPRDRRPGHPTRASALATYQYVRAVIHAAQQGELDAICTAPVSKETLLKARLPFVGHTEMLAEAFSTDVLMLMAGPKLKVALATNHLPLARVPRALNTPRLVSQLVLLSKALKRNGKKPRIAVCGLNPHAGEGGMMGKEEVTVIAPAVRRARQEGVDAHGPFPADGLFAKLHTRWEYDAVLAMFHDQGLCVAKALDFRRTVNVTLGLPIPRTSPDHGTGYDIAGKARADSEPMIQALLLAAELAKRH